MRRLAALSLGVGVASGVGVGIGACGGSSFSASEDAGVTVDAGDAGSHFCPAATDPNAFCDDFDEGNALGVNWPAIVDTGTTVKDDGTIFVSSPDSFEADVPAGLVSSKATIGRTFAVASRITIGFDLHIDRVGVKSTIANSGTTLLLLKLGGDYQIGISANQSDVNGFQDQTLADGGVTETVQTIFSTSSILNNWAHLTFDVQLDAGKITGTVAGASYGPLAITPPQGGTPTLYLGLQAKNVATETEAHFDNVTVTVTPKSP